MRTRSLPSSLCIGSCLLLAFACGDNASPMQTVQDGSPQVVDAGVDASIEVEPTVAFLSCRYEVPANLGLVEGEDYQCGDLSVPEDWDATSLSSKNISVHFIRFFHGTEPRSNATIYLDGGPGGDGSGMVARLGIYGQDYLSGLLVDGDFLVVSQRGTGLSTPALKCTALDECSMLDADLASYHTANNADDINALRQVLGYDKLNLYGISYGSRLALEVMRRHGETIRSSTIGGLVPSQVNWVAGTPASFYSALTGLQESCDVDGGCLAAYGDLESKFLSGVFDLLDEPLEFNFGSLDGFTYASIVFRLMYSKQSYSVMPLLISDIAERRGDRVESFLANVFSGLGGNDRISYGMYSSVVCNELFNPIDEGALEAANLGVPEDIVALFSGGWYSLSDTCATWPTRNVQASLRVPVSSDVLTLVASGRLDPITPPSYGDIAEEGLAQSTHVVFQNSGHGATLQSACGRDLFLEFLADPSTSLDASCAADISTEFSIPSSVYPSDSIDWKLLQDELRLAPAMPIAVLKHPLAKKRIADARHSN